MAEPERRVLGTCCVCEKPCVTGQRLMAGAPDCLVRHYECEPPKKVSQLTRKPPTS